MPKPTLFNRANMSKRKGKFKQVGEKQQELGSSVKKYNDERFKYNSTKNMSFAISYIPRKCRQTYLFTFQNWDKHLLTEDELDKVVWDRPLSKISDTSRDVIKDIIFTNKQEWIDDMYLAQNGIIAVDYISKKYGFDEYCANGGRGKTFYNIVVKRYFLVSGGRVNFMSRNHRLMGVEHINGKSGNNLNKQDFEIYEIQSTFVKDLPNRSSERNIYQPSKWAYELVQIIDGMKPNYVKKDNKGNILKCKGNSKYILYDMKGLQSEVKTLITYKQFYPYEDRLKEIISNFPKISVNQ